MTNNIIKHPIFNYATDIAEICKPLHFLNINYFCHIHIDKNKQFSAINNNPAFTKCCIDNKLFNVDIHLLNNENCSPEFLVWDDIICSGNTFNLYKIAGEHGIKHIFTIIQKSKKHCDLYHFASNDSSPGINQLYFQKYDLLLMFINYFQDKLNDAKGISEAYQIKIGEVQNAECKADLVKQNFTPKSEHYNFIQAIMSDCVQTKDFSTNLSIPLTKKELLCLDLTVKGYTAEEISASLFLSRRTIEDHIENIKNKLGFKKKSELRKFFNI